MKTENFVYKGRRIHIKRSDLINTGDPTEFNIIDSHYNAAFGVTKQLLDGSWTGCIVHGPHDIPIKGDSPREIAKIAYWYLTKLLLKN